MAFWKGQQDNIEPLVHLRRRRERLPIPSARCHRRLGHEGTFAASQIVHKLVKTWFAVVSSTEILFAQPQTLEYRRRNILRHRTPLPRLEEKPHHGHGEDNHPTVEGRRHAPRHLRSLTGQLPKSKLLRPDVNMYQYELIFRDDLTKNYNLTSGPSAT